MPELTWQAVPGANKRLEFSIVSPGRPFVVSALRMEPGCLLPAHCHPHGGGITLCLEGSLMMQHFQLIDGSAQFSEIGGRVEMEEVSLTQLSPGHFTLFTPSRLNLHQLRAGPSGALALEPAVQWKGCGEFSYLKLTDGLPATPETVARRRHGIWVGMDLAKAYAV